MGFYQLARGRQSQPGPFLPRGYEGEKDPIGNRGIDGCWAAAWDPDWRP